MAQEAAAIAKIQGWLVASRRRNTGKCTAPPPRHCRLQPPPPPPRAAGSPLASRRQKPPPPPSAAGAARLSAAPATPAPPHASPPRCRRRRQLAAPFRRRRTATPPAAVRRGLPPNTAAACVRRCARLNQIVCPECLFYAAPTPLFANAAISASAPQPPADMMLPAEAEHFDTTPPLTLAAVAVRMMPPACRRYAAACLRRHRYRLRYAPLRRPSSPGH